MKWNKVEDYPVGSDEYVLVSSVFPDAHNTKSCFTAKLRNGFWDDGMEMRVEAQPTDRWCYIDLPED